MDYKDKIIFDRRLKRINIFKIFLTLPLFISISLLLSGLTLLNLGYLFYPTHPLIGLFFPGLMIVWIMIPTKELCKLLCH